MAITKEDLNTITQVIERQVKKAIDAINKANELKEAEERDYYRETELLLYNYKILKLKVETDEEFLFDPDAATFPTEKSKDIVCFSTKNVGAHGLDIDYYTQGIKSSMMRTRQEVLRIERALKAVEHDKYYKIIPMKYFEGLSIEEIIKELDCDERTYRRNRKRLVDKIMKAIFGYDAVMCQSKNQKK